MRLFIIFILFFISEYFLRTFVDAYKYHSVGLFLEFLPLIIATVVSGLIYKKSITTGHFGWTYLKLIGVSIAGLVIVKAFLFIQWYWFIAPEYRNVPGDMTEGLGFTIVFLTFGTVVILLSYLFVMLTLKTLAKRTTAN
ncbi:MAG TPA: hypothetical protein PL029_07060 [Bacteroidia bacterium]|nr:hypothetical protein [Bacteroidia bacterium]